MHTPAQLPVPSTDLMIIGGILLVVVYGIVAGIGSLIRETISVYVGLVLANTFGHQLYEYSKQSAGGNFPVSETQIKLMLLILPIVLLLFAHRRGHVKHSAHIVSVLVLAVLSSMLLISSALAQLDPVSLAHATDGSNLAAQIYNLHLLWIGAVPVAIAFAAFFHPHPHGKHH